MKATGGEYFRIVYFVYACDFDRHLCIFRFCTNDYQDVVAWFNSHYTVKYFFPFVTAYFVIMNFAYLYKRKG